MKLKRPFVCFILSNLLSLMLFEILKDTFMYIYVSVSLVLFVFSCIFLFKRSKNALLCVILGIFLAAFQSFYCFVSYECSALTLIGDNAEILGTITDLTQTEKHVIFDVSGERMDAVGEKQNIRCFLEGECDGLFVGSTVRLLCDIEAIESEGLTENAFLRSERIFLSATVHKLEITEGPRGIISVINGIREGFEEILDKSGTSHLMKAALLGDKSNVSSEFKEAMRRVGASHLLAISGMHLVLVISSFFALLFAISVNHKLNVLITAALCIFYMLLTGLSSSVLRAGIMMLALLLSELLKHRRDSLSALLFSVFAICLFNKYAVLDIGLLLSFSACLGIISLSSRLNSPHYFRLSSLIFYERSVTVRALLYGLRFAVGQLCVSVAAFLFTLPAVLIFFERVCVFSVAYNVLFAALFTPAMISALLFLVFSALPLDSHLPKLLSLFSDLFFSAFEGSVYLFSSVKAGIFGSFDPFSLAALLLFSFVLIYVLKKKYPKRIENFSTL